MQVRNQKSPAGHLHDHERDTRAVVLLDLGTSLRRKRERAEEGRGRSRRRSPGGRRRPHIPMLGAGETQRDSPLLCPRGVASCRALWMSGTSVSSTLRNSPSDTPSRKKRILRRTRERSAVSEVAPAMA